MQQEEIWDQLKKALQENIYLHIYCGRSSWVDRVRVIVIDRTFLGVEHTELRNLIWDVFADMR